MLRLWKLLITGDAHIHIWEEYKEETLVDERTEDAIGLVSCCKCSICGARTLFKLSIR